MTGPVTPRLSQHARERCGEMGISTKVAKRIVQKADLRRSAKGLMMATSDEEPSYAVVYEDTNPPVIVSVVFRTTDEYTRAGPSFKVRKR